MNGLEPIISEEILRLHYESHHQGHIQILNMLLPELDDFVKYGGIDINFLGQAK